MVPSANFDKLGWVAEKRDVASPAFSLESLEKKNNVEEGSVVLSDSGGKNNGSKKLKKKS